MKIQFEIKRLGEIHKNENKELIISKDVEFLKFSITNFIDDLDFQEDDLVLPIAIIVPKQSIHIKFLVDDISIGLIKKELKNNFRKYIYHPKIKEEIQPVKKFSLTGFKNKYKKMTLKEASIELNFNENALKSHLSRLKINEIDFNSKIGDNIKYLTDFFIKRYRLQEQNSLIKKTEKKVYKESTYDKINKNKGTGKLIYIAKK